MVVFIVGDGVAVAAACCFSSCCSDGGGLPMLLIVGVFAFVAVVEFSPSLLPCSFLGS